MDREATPGSTILGMGHMRYAASCARGRCDRSKRGLWLVLLTILGVMAVPAAAAQADATWTGASSSSYWSSVTNWTGSTPPITSNTAAGTLVFPTLGTCSTCYASRDDLSGISATGVVFGNTTGQYRILGNRLTVGTGGISESEGGAHNVINAPLALGGSQTWVVGSTLYGYDSLTVLGGVIGTSAQALTLSAPRGDLFVDSDMEVGPVTFNGPGGLHIGGKPGSGHPGSVNGSDGQPVTINGGALVINPSSMSGPLAVKSGTLLLGTNAQNNGTTTLQVNGAASLGSSTTTKTFINQNGSTPGTDFSQVSATGNITVGGQLVVGQGPSNGTCVVLNSGDVATLITTAGTLSGTYANAPQGTILTMASSCQSTRPRVRINYTTNSVTATVI